MIEVQSCARLHLGLLDNNGDMGRLYGSIGVAVSRPKFVLKADSARTLKVEGADGERVAEFARRCIREFGFPSGAYIKVENGIPPHVGLGSGTQLALSVGTALSRLSGREISLKDIALKVGRGEHSGIGISTFLYGGFVLDGGRRIVSDPLKSDPAAASVRRLEKDRIPPVLFRRAMPGSWHFVVAIPKTGPGLSGKKEKDAFVTLPPAPSSLVEKISRVLLIRMLPALVEKDIANFGLALTQIQCMVGDCFASVQGGRFANPISEKMVEFMLAEGAAGIGQSSWGPAVYGLVEGKTKAIALMRKAGFYLDSLGGGEIFLARPENRGAKVTAFDEPVRPEP
jgi:beta-ribofuranosylaminobenzene 5'-phosphate synthase